MQPAHPCVRVPWSRPGLSCWSPHLPTMIIDVRRDVQWQKTLGAMLATPENMASRRPKIRSAGSVKAVKQPADQLLRKVGLWRLEAFDRDEVSRLPA